MIIFLKFVKEICFFLLFFFIWFLDLEYGFEVFGNVEGCFGFGFDFFDGDVGGDFDEGEVVGEVDVEDILLDIVRI